jgi:metal-responsive CopG/Arc/MetJ family transcriptional regulator
VSIEDNMKIRKPRAKQPGELIGVRLQPEPLARLDDWRREQDDLPNRSEAIRRLIDQALNSSAAKDVKRTTIQTSRKKK